MKIYEKIKEIRLQRAMNQQVLADWLKLDVSAVSNIEKGKRDLRFCELEKIANLFEMPVVDIVTWPKKYVEQNQPPEPPVEAILQLKLNEDKKKQILQIVFGDNIEVLNL